MAPCPPRASRRPRPRAATSHSRPLPTPATLALLVALLALAAPSRAVPFRPDSAAPGHWADLLASDRYTLQRLPPRLLYADARDVADVSLGLNMTTARAARAAGDGGSKQSGQFLRSTARNEYTGRGRLCEMKVVVENAPRGLNVAAAVKEMIEVIGSAWRSTVTVHARIKFEELAKPNILAKGGGMYFVRMNDQFRTLLPVAAAEAYRERDLNGNREGDGKYDVLITLNSATSWFVGNAEGLGENQYDLVTVLLHEAYHNFLFAGSITATVKPLPDGGFEQSATLFKDYRTRFDSFLATKSGCGVLGYLSDSVNQLSTQVSLTKDKLLAEALCNDNLFWWANGQQIAKLHAPRIFMHSSSVYHLDPTYEKNVGNEVMFPTIKRGSHARKIGQVIITMQQYTLDPKFNGALAGCALADPVQRKPDDSDVPPPVEDVDGGVLANLPSGAFDEPGVAGLPIWALVLIIIFAVLLLLLLLALCLLLLKKKKKTTFASLSRYTSSFRGTSSVSQSRTKTGGYLPGWGNMKHSSKRTSVAATESYRKSHGKSSSKKTKSTTDVGPDETTDPCPPCPPCQPKKKCCKPKGVTRPPPIASVHTFDPDCVPSPKRHHHHHHHHHHHKSSNKCGTAVAGASSSHRPKCKRKSSKCEEVVCVDVTTSGEITCAPTSSKCAPPSPKRCSSASRPCPPSTKPPSTKVCGKSTKASCSKRAPPSTKPPPTRKRSKCENVVEINIEQNC